MTHFSLPLTITPPLATLQRDGDGILILDQTLLPHQSVVVRLNTLEAVAKAICNMQVRGAPLIGVSAAFGVAIALQTDASDNGLAQALSCLAMTRPTAINLQWALARMRQHLTDLSANQRPAAAWQEAESIRQEDVAVCRAIGEHGLALLIKTAAIPHATVRVMTHCNAGWIATLGIGTALAPVYVAHAQGLEVHVWVSETRPRNQGLLTAWELTQAGVPCTLVTDNAAGILLANGEVDLVMTGADRIAANGDSANKVGTYLKALAAQDNGIPFYIAAPLSSIDFSCANAKAIPIENRDGDEVRVLKGLATKGESGQLRQLASDVAVLNPAFDVTPARLITGILTEHGVHPPDALQRLHGLR